MIYKSQPTFQEAKTMHKQLIEKIATGVYCGHHNIDDITPDHQAKIDSLIDGIEDQLEIKGKAFPQLITDISWLASNLLLPH